jgi:hypothetical protein
MTDKLDPLEMVRLRLAREAKPPSRALPAKNYRDPAESIQFESERRAKKFKNTKRGHSGNY